MSDRNSIIHLPHKSLRKQSADVSFPLTNEMQRLIQDMKSATLDWEQHRDHEVGVALAAVQINKLHRVVVVRHEFDDKKNQKFDVFINPSISRYDGEPEEDFEGCLSIKNVYGKVPRYPKVKIKAMDENGVAIKKVVKGFLARVFQHEIDHTNGITYADRIGKNGTFYFIDGEGTMTELTSDEHKKLMTDLEIS